MRGGLFQKDEIVLSKSGCRNELAKDLEPEAMGQDIGLGRNIA